MTVDPDGQGETNRRILIPAGVATIAMLVVGVALALTPYVVFHSRQAGTYDGYHTGGVVVGLLSLVPANLLALSVLWPRTRRRFRVPLVLVLVVLTALAAFLLYWVFVVIYLSTVDWFVF